MKRLTVLNSMVVFTVATMAFSAWSETAAAAPADRVVAIYFHRTQRCPTCKKMGSYSEEAVKKGFAKEAKAGKVEFHHIDFQDPKNAAFAKAYRVSGPALIVAKVVKNKVKEFKDLKDIWANVREKPKFLKYVQDNVKAYMK